jgi:EAL domain-containing protein (putative c-di-GMP-specific phosphodiesterase class I)
MHFDLIRCNRSLISELQGISAKTPQNEPGKEKSTHSQLDLIKSRSSRFIADDIVDATTLTECISIGTDYAMGVFIGEPVTQLDDMTNIESFEIV